jgi:hypothetical protein
MSRLREEQLLFDYDTLDHANYEAVVFGGFPTKFGIIYHSVVHVTSGRTSECSITYRLQIQLKLWGLTFS